MTIGTSDVAGLRSRFNGALLTSGDEDYDESSRIWNGAIDRRPALIVRCTGTATSSKRFASLAPTTSSFPSVVAATPWLAMPCATTGS